MDVLNEPTQRPDWAPARRSEGVVALQTEALAIGYHRRRAALTIASHLALTLRAGQIVCLLGPNGVGKSTLLRTLAGMQPALAGSVHVRAGTALVELGSLSVQERARRIAVVLTRRHDLGLLRAYDLVALGRYPYTDWTGRLRPEDHRAVRHALDAVGAQALARRVAAELSDGERQKVMIARALAQESGMILLDEPTAYLDLPRRVEMMAMLRALARRTQRAILLSTHDLELALRIADTVWLMQPSAPMVCGLPEELVLNGAFAAVFGSKDVRFDDDTGTFRMQGGAAGNVSVEGDGRAVRWTIHALERSGFSVNRAPNGLRVVVEEGDRALRWRVGDQVHESIDAMLRDVQQTMHGPRR